jgi:mycothiol system anti-sigma-R factor
VCPIFWIAVTITPWPFTDTSRDCAAILAHAVAWVDGVLRGEERSRVRAHLDACASCRRALESDAALRRRLRRVLPDRAPQSLRTRIDSLRRQAQ